MLAAAITKNALLVALIAVARYLPWIFASLPAGVAADRLNRRRLMAVANTCRGAMTLALAATVATRSHDEWLQRLDRSIGSASVLFATLLVITVTLGVAEVVYDTSAQSLLPSIVAPETLARANSRLWTVEAVCNHLLGPGVAAILISVEFVSAFVFDALTFVVSAVLVFGLQVSQTPMTRSSSWWADAKEGLVALRVGVGTR